MNYIRLIIDKVKTPNNLEISIKYYASDSKQNTNEETIVFLNSLFFNQKQWEQPILKIDSMLSNQRKISYLTYDYAGIGESDYYPKIININDFLDEFESIIRWLGNKKVHIFGMSIGAWIGINIYFLKPNFVKSFAGYGNLAPYHNIYQKTISNFQKLENSLTFLKDSSHQEIDIINWKEIFESFYFPFFFPEFSSIKNNLENLDYLKTVLSKLIFPLTKRNKIKSYSDYYIYLTQTIVEESKELLKLIETSNISIPLLLMNGKRDTITDYLMTLDLNRRISHSKLNIFENLGHGSILLGKGYTEILSRYLDFIDL